MTVKFAVSHVERLVVDQEAKQFPVGDVEDNLITFGVTVTNLGVR